MIYMLGLGSNLGDKRRNLARARRLLERGGVRVLKASSVYRTEPVDVREQPWFENQVLKVRTRLGPHELLDLAKSIERTMKRAPTVEKGARTIDIDILLAEDSVIDTPGLTVPHPSLERRNFVLVPLMEIAPEVVHPVLKKTAREMAAESADPSAVLKIPKRPRRPRPNGGRPRRKQSASQA
jgi:2-amino-4-hydroxy-6-hydroxymethyldihydropteridine diphosphokinase